MQEMEGKEKGELSPTHLSATHSRIQLSPLYLYRQSPISGRNRNHPRRDTDSAYNHFTPRQSGNVDDALDDHLSIPELSVDHGSDLEWRSSRNGGMTLRLTAAAEMTSELDEQRERADDGRGVED